MQTKKGLSGSTLKIIAMLSMLTDHIAYIFLKPQLLSCDDGSRLYVLYRIMREGIGRLAFPLYCFLLVEGFQKTSSRKKYGSRLFVFALLSELPFDFAFYGTFWETQHSNVFFTLFLSFLMLVLLEKLETCTNRIWFVFMGDAAVIFGFALLAELIGCDYGAKGIAAVALLYLFRRDKWEQIIAGCVAFLWEITAPLAFIPVAFYNGKKGLRLKYVFYLFYPLHLLLLGALARMLISG
jgi:hypothetical protein